MNVQLEEVSFAFRGRSILQKVTATITTGAFICLLGPNGAGKTTLFRLLTGQLRVTQGHILLAGADASALPRSEIARRFAILPQGVQNPPHVTVSELVALGRFRPRQRLRWRLRESDRAAIAASLRRCGVDQLANRSFAELSGGEKQRAWLAFCLVQEKEFLLLDESLAALDFPSRRAFFELLATLASEGRGVLLITHDLDLANQFATGLMVLRRGALAYGGPPRSDLWPLLAADQESGAA